SANLLTGRSVVRTRPLPLLPLSRLGRPGSIQALVPPSCGMAARHRKGATAGRLTNHKLGQPGSIPALVPPSGGLIARHRKGAAAERFFSVNLR
ncbi:hypothetical protein T265_13727, partial [Opisthorchis viverrini]